MSAAIINQPWEDVADDVTSAIEKAVQPLLKKAVDDIYSGLLDTTQDYLTDNLAFNIASRISVAEREAASARDENKVLLGRIEDLLLALYQYRNDLKFPPAPDSVERRLAMIDALTERTKATEGRGL